MPHQCVKCSSIIPLGSKELLDGCSSCGGRFFFYIKEEQLNKIRENIIDIPDDQKEEIERDIRDIAGIVDDDMPVILDLESIRVTGEGKFELDLVKLFNKKRPLIYKIQEGKYIIDLASTLQQSMSSIKGIKNPNEDKE